MEKFETQFKYAAAEDEERERKQKAEEKAVKPERAAEQNKEPIAESPDSVSYLGVRLKKAKNRESEFVPPKEQYADYINDKFSSELQKKIAVSFLEGSPIFIEGGTSIGKTTAVKKMCADLGWEVHYANLNGLTDVEDLMGRYIPNPSQRKPEDPAYIFADGRVTSGLRQEEGKIKVVIIDEINAAAPNVLIRLHEVLDALERNGDVVLSEDASETVRVDKEKTKIIGLANPPGKGYFGREPLDPAQLRRWVYQKEVTDLPESSFSRSADVLFNLTSPTEKLPEESFLSSRPETLPREELAEIPGIGEILEKYKEFHRAAKEMLKNRHIAADQPQPFTFDDRMEPKRVRDFVLRFYNGDINETFQQALRYYYANKLESEEDREKLEELIRNVGYAAKPEESKRKGLEQERVAEAEGLAKEFKVAHETKLEGAIAEQIKEAREILGKDVMGPEEAEKAFGIRFEAKDIPEIPFSREELEKAKSLGQFLILRAAKAPDKSPLTMEKMNGLLKERFEKEGKGRILYEEKGWKEKEEFFVREAPKASWALTSKEVIPDSTNKNYLEQTREIAKYLKEKVFSGKIPEEYRDAVKEFESQEKEIGKLIDSDWKKAAEKLADLKINQLTRQTPAEALYDTLVYFQNTGRRLNEKMYTWTKRRSSDGRFVHVGRFDSGGADAYGGRPGHSGDGLGVSFSRSK